MMRYLILVQIVFGLVVADSWNAAFAGNVPVGVDKAPQSVRQLDVTIGSSSLIELPADAKEVYVVNPAIANAIVRTARKLYLIGLADGETSVFATDSEGHTLVELQVRVSRNLNDLQRLLEIALPNSQIKLTGVRTTIILTGTASSAEEAQQASDIAKGYIASEPTDGGKPAAEVGRIINALTIRSRDQVMLKVSISEVQRTVLKQLGIETQGTWSIGDLLLTESTSFPTVRSPSTTIGATLVNDSNSARTSLKALERAGVLRTLAEPNLTAISGESAKFSAGGEIPVPNSNNCAFDLLGRQNCQISFVYKPIGVSLAFTPVVLSEGRISLHISTEVTEVDPGNETKLTDTTIPAFKSRKMDTTVELASGAMLVSAGLIQQQSSQSINGTPGLMNIPILGALFRSRDYQRQETELLISVVPYIAKPSPPTSIARPDDGFADASDAQSIFFGRLNHAYRTLKPNLGRVYTGYAGFTTE